MGEPTCRPSWPNTAATGTHACGVRAMVDAATGYRSRSLPAKAGHQWNVYLTAMIKDVGTRRRESASRTVSEFRTPDSQAAQRADLGVAC
jgi:hypothetical protein